MNKLDTIEMKDRNEYIGNEYVGKSSLCLK